jgi:hypothetical protein
MEVKPVVQYHVRISLLQFKEFQPARGSFVDRYPAINV